MVLVDDVGSFPFPAYTRRNVFNELYFKVYDYLCRSELPDNRAVQMQFIHPIMKAFSLKVESGLDAVNYPQMFDMNKQFLEPILEFQEKPFLINKSKALIPEVEVIRKYFKSDEPVNLKVCVTGPLELYLKTEFEFTVYPDLLFNMAKSVNYFIKSAVINTENLITSVISIDEPSLGYVDLFNCSEDSLIKAFDACFKGVPMDKIHTQIHLHTLSKSGIPLSTENIECLTSEYASGRNNVIPYKTLEEYDKFIRVSVVRTDYDAILSGLLESGITLEGIDSSPELLIDSPDKIRKCFRDARKLYKDRLLFVGPECGLASWRSPEFAKSLLSRTVSAVKK